MVALAKCVGICCNALGKAMVAPNRGGLLERGRVAAKRHLGRSAGICFDREHALFPDFAEGPARFYRAVAVRAVKRRRDRYVGVER